MKGRDAGKLFFKFFLKFFEHVSAPNRADFLDDQARVILTAARNLTKTCSLSKNVGSGPRDGLRKCEILRPESVRDSG